MDFRWKLVNFRRVLCDSWVAAADAEIVDIPKEYHRFQPGQDSFEALWDDVLGENVWFGDDFRWKVGVLGLILGEK